MIAAIAALLACNGKPEETDVVLPPEDTDIPRDTDVSDFPEDTGLDTGLNQAPIHTVTLHQWGLWSLSPSGGAYDAMSGELYVQEYIDGERPDTADTDPDTDLVLDCDLLFSLSGTPSATSCSGCAFTFDVTFALASGDPGMCNDPELPEDTEVHRFGFSQSEAAIFYDFGGIGVWLPWYPAVKVDDVVTFDWEATIGIAIEEEDE
jgi:hypothetical protein